MQSEGINGPQGIHLVLGWVCVVRYVVRGRAESAMFFFFSFRFPLLSLMAPCHAAAWLGQHHRRAVIGLLDSKPLSRALPTA